MIISDFLAKNIRKYRKLKGITQEQLAYLSGVSQMSIRRYETIGKNNREPNNQALQNIANALNVSILTLLYGEVGSKEVDYSRDVVIVDNDGCKQKVSGDFIRELAEYSEEVNKKRINRIYDSLNMTGKSRLIDYGEDLTKIPEYQKKDE